MTDVIVFIVFAMLTLILGLAGVKIPLTAAFGGVCGIIATIILLADPNLALQQSPTSQPIWQGDGSPFVPVMILLAIMDFLILGVKLRK